MTWEYDVATHTFTRDGESYTADYAGASGYKDDTSQECVKNSGPLPRGTYTIGAPHHSPHTGKYTLDLTPLFPERHVWALGVQDPRSQ